MLKNLFETSEDKTDIKTKLKQANVSNKKIVLMKNMPETKVYK